MHPMSEPREEIDVLFVGQTGVGKSTLVNMIRGINDSSPMAAKVSNDARPCTSNTFSYSMGIGSLHFNLWDTRGLDEVVDNQDRRFMARIMDRIRQLALQQERELKETIRSRTRICVPILMWCIHATKIDVPIHWQQFRKVYVEYCEKRAIPVVVLTRMAPNTVGWEQRCREQLRSLDLGPDSEEIFLLRVRRHLTTSSEEYFEDCEALKSLVVKASAERNYTVDFDFCSSLFVDLVWFTE